MSAYWQCLVQLTRRIWQGSCKTSSMAFEHYSDTNVATREVVFCPPPFSFKTKKIQSLAVAGRISLLFGQLPDQVSFLAHNPQLIRPGGQLTDIKWDVLLLYLLFSLAADQFAAFIGQRYI